MVSQISGLRVFVSNFPDDFVKPVFWTFFLQSTSAVKQRIDIPIDLKATIVSIEIPDRKGWLLRGIATAP